MTEAKRMMQYDANKKQVLVAYLFWFFLGMLGGHRFYIGLKGSGTAILLLTVLAVFLRELYTVVPKRRLYPRHY